MTSSGLTEKIASAVECNVEYIVHRAFLKWVVGVAFLVLTLVGVIIAAGIGPVSIPPKKTAIVLLSHLPGLGAIGNSEKKNLSKEINVLKDERRSLEMGIKKLQSGGVFPEQLAPLKSKLVAVRDKLECVSAKMQDIENYEIWIWEGRMPRIMIALLAGAALAVSGAILQGLVLNPLASSSTLGVSAGAAAGASLFIVFGLGTALAGSPFAIPVAAFSGGLLTLSTVWFVARSGRGSTSPLSLILAGIIVGLFLSAAMSFIRIIAEEESLRTLTLWGVGSLASREWIHVKMSWLIVIGGIFLAIVFSRDLNILALGGRQARHLGVNVLRSRQILMIVAALATAGAVSVAGPIAFIGLVVPHSVRMLIGPDHRTLIPFSALSGGLFLVICDTVGRTIATPLELPVGIVTSLIGAPFFVYIYKTRMREGAVIT